MIKEAVGSVRLALSNLPICTFLILLLNVLSFNLVDQNSWAVAGQDIFNPLHWYKLLTSMYAHGSFQHIVSNLMFAFPFLALAEYNFGSIRLFLYYNFCGIIASIFGCFAYFKAEHILGSSGAIAALIPLLFFVKHKSMSMLLFCFGFVGMIFLKEMYGTMNMFSSIGHWVHLGGMIVSPYAYILFLQRKQP